MSHIISHTSQEAFFIIGKPLGSLTASFFLSWKLE